MAHFGGGHLKMKGESSDGTFPFRPRVTAVWANDACRFIKRAAPSSAKDDKHEAKVKYLLFPYHGQASQKSLSPPSRPGQLLDRLHHHPAIIIVHNNGTNLPLDARKSLDRISRSLILPRDDRSCIREARLVDRAIESWLMSSNSEPGPARTQHFSVSHDQRLSSLRIIPLSIRCCSQPSLNGVGVRLPICPKSC